MTIRVSLLQSSCSFQPASSHCPSPATLPYCDKYNPSVAATKIPCYDADALDVAYPYMTGKQFFATTAMTDYAEQLDTTNFQWMRANFSVNETYYIARIEDFTMRLDHKISVAALEIFEDSQNMNGRLLDTNGNSVVSWKAGLNATSRIVTIGQLLQAANIQSLEILSDSSDSAGQSLRSAGLVLSLNIDYNNTFSFDQNNFEYLIRVSKVLQTNFKVDDAIFQAPSSSDTVPYPKYRIRQKRRGILFQFQESGSVGAFDFQTMLINLLSGVGLLSIAVSLVDFVMIQLFWCRPRRRIDPTGSKPLRLKETYRLAKEEEWNSAALRRLTFSSSNTKRSDSNGLGESLL